MAGKKDQPSFENAIERLEAIVEQMESDSLPLEDLLTRYEEGLKLVKFCSEKLDAAVRVLANLVAGAKEARARTLGEWIGHEAGRGFGGQSDVPTREAASSSTAISPSRSSMP